MNDTNEQYSQLRRGLMEAAVLSVVSARKVYAADILSALSATEFATGEGTLYPLLSRLRREGYIDYEWVESEAGPPRKYYRLTESGRSQLGQLRDYLEKMHVTLSRLGGEHE
jgi:PadR family transcriptional regulator PadR